MKGWVLLGADGFLGQAIARTAHDQGHSLHRITRRKLDLTHPEAVARSFRRLKPKGVLVAAGKNAGIGPNAAAPWDFLRENLMIQTHVLNAAVASGTHRLILFGTSAVYSGNRPAHREAEIARGLPPLALRGYGVAKVTAVLQCWAINRQHGTSYGILTIPNLYGPGMPWVAAQANAFGGILARIWEARAAGRDTVPLLGNPSTRREFLFVEDLARLSMDLARGRRESVFRYFRSAELPHLHAGTGADISLGELARRIAGELGWKGNFRWQGGNAGASRKLLDSRQIRRLGWKAETGLREGIRRTVAWMEEVHGRN